MELYSVTDREFAPYGKVLQGFPVAELQLAMETIALPEEGTAYECSIPVLEEIAGFSEYRDRAFGGLPIQIGMCWGRNTRLNCLEYHRSSEINLGTEAFVLLLARVDEIEEGILDTGKVKAFRVPAGTVVEIYATTLHYAPCQTRGEPGFRVAVILPKGTNGERPSIQVINKEDCMLRANNKWLLAHPEAPEALQEAHVGLTGDNIDLADGPTC